MKPDPIFDTHFNRNQACEDWRQGQALEPGLFFWRDFPMDEKSLHGFRKDHEFEIVRKEVWMSPLVGGYILFE